MLIEVRILNTLITDVHSATVISLEVCYSVTD